MWNVYSKSYLKHNRASGVTIAAAALLAAMFLSFLWCMGYNLWTYEVEQIIREEGDWQGRIVGEVDAEALSTLKNFSNVKTIVIHEASAGEKTAIDVYFQNARTIYQDMPLLVQYLGLDEDAAEYHSGLLSQYLIHDPQEARPPLLLALYLGVLLMVSLSLILIIRNSFEISMQARIHQFGILSGIGATAKQIRICLLQEAAALCALPILLGGLLGIAISFGVIEAINLFAADVAGRAEAVFSYRVGVYAAAILTAVLTVLFSAWIPARILSKLTPLQAIRGEAGSYAARKGRSRILPALFGIEGELAGNALRAQRRALRLSAVSLLLSFLCFSIMLCFTTLSEISTRHTYFERYQDAWDVMITVKDTPIEAFALTKELQELSGIEAVTVYQKAEGMSVLPESAQSDELVALGGFQILAEQADINGTLQVEVPFIILDDDSFLAYCAQIGTSQTLDGAIVLNRIWDNQNSNFRYKKYIPFVNETNQTTMLLRDNHSGQASEIPVVSYTQEVPLLREEYDNYTLVHFVPVSLWKTLSDQIAAAEADSYIRILAKEETTLETLNAIQAAASALVFVNYEIESENRMQEKLANDSMITGTQVIWGSFCVLLGMIGIANVFSHTLGFLRQRKREFAQYLSIGLTPDGMKKLFLIEGLVIAGRPLLITIPLTVLFVQFAITASYLNPAEFWAEAPIIPILLFAAAIVGFVALAYYIGGKRILQCDLNELLKNDTLI